MIAADRNAGGMNLRETGIGEERAFFVSAIGGGDVATARVGRKIKNIAVAAGREHDRVAGVRFDFPGDQIARDDSFGVAIDQDEIEHFGLRKHLDGAGGDLPAERLISAEQEVAGRSGRARKTSAKPARRRTSDWPAARRIRARTARPARRIGR